MTILPYVAKGLCQYDYGSSNGEILLGLSQLAQHNHRRYYERQENQVRVIWRCYAAGFEDRGRGHKAKKCVSPL